MAETRLGDAAQMLLEEVARAFTSSGNWPVWMFVDRVLDKAGHSAEATLAEIPDGLMRPTRWLSPKTEVQLTVLGLAATSSGAADVELFLDVLVWCVKRERAAEPGAPGEADPLIVRSEDFASDRQARGLPAGKLEMIKAYELLSSEWLSGSGSHHPETGQWATTVDDKLRPYRGVQTLDDYQRVRAKLNEDRRMSVGQLQTAARRSTPLAAASDPSSVFVVHGRNAAARDAMFEFLRSLGLTPIEWSQAVQRTGKGSPYIGEVLDAAFAAAQAVVILMTPDEVAYLRPEYAARGSDPDLRPAAQARPNVLFEAGMAMGRESERAILVELGAVRPFSDVAGRHSVRLDNSRDRRRELASRLATAGCPVSLDGDGWATAGDFAAPLPLASDETSRWQTAPTAASRVLGVDLRYREGDGGRLDVINTGTEALLDLNLEIPPTARNFHLASGDLPIPKLAAGRSVTLWATVSIAPGPTYFDVRVTARTASGTPFAEDVLLSLLA